MLCWSGSVKRKQKPGPFPVYLNVYDLTPMNAYGYWLGLGVFHSGVEVHGVEYAFGAHEYPSTGIFEVEPKKCPGFTFRKSILVGKTDTCARDVRVYMEKLAEEYRGNKYNLISRNCNHFCNEVCVKLTQKPIPRWVNRLARLGVLCNCVLPPRLNESKVRRVVKEELSEGEKKRMRNTSRSGPLLTTSSSSSTPDNNHRSHIRAKSTGNHSSSSMGTKEGQRHCAPQAQDKKSPSGHSLYEDEYIFLSRFTEYTSMARRISSEIAGESKLYEFSDEILVISLSGIDDVGGKKEDICPQIMEAFEKWGMVQAIDHGVDTNLMADMTSLARDFFALTTEEKLRFDMSGEAMKDWREIVMYSTYPVSTRDYSRWPDKPEGWLKVTEEYSERLIGLAYKVLEVLSEAMGLEKDALKNACVDMEQKIVVNYFPKRPKLDLALGMRHTDHGIITLLLQDQVSCLQATRDNGNTWVTVPLVPGALVINLGDIGHEVHDFRPSGGGLKSSKLFINIFFFPAPHATVYPLKVRDGEKTIIEEPISFEEITMRKLKDL
ncbi:hypothetical protein HID58_036019 [Brassica napus]|uniref:Uncharacterized protein n=1 Tax=Brassica napus TaxID=3708 RepID=A0ABQ8C7Z9_BRANA|nr:hypothetical protein HID58_036019 [Brassica napus]